MNCNQLISHAIGALCEAHQPGYESRAVLINREDLDELTFDATNPNLVTAITLKTGKNGYLVKQSGKPFNGTKGEAVVGDYGNSFTKTVQIVSNETGADASLNLYDGILNGEFLLLIEHKDKTNNGAFELLGSETGLKMASMVKDNSVQGARWIITLTEESSVKSEVIFHSSTYAATKAAFEALLPA